jgi:hypothetical protein
VEVIADRPHHHGPGVHAYPDADFDAVRPAHLVAVVAHGLLHGQRRVARPHGVVFMRDRCPEQGLMPSPMTWLTVPS